MDSQFVFLLNYVDKEWLDIGGNQYPQYGFIEAKKFTDDIDIRYGLYGTLWGRSHQFLYEDNTGNWTVVRAQKNHHLIPVEKYYNRYKCKKGIVVQSGSLKNCTDFIWNNRKNPRYLLSEEVNSFSYSELLQVP